MGGAGTIDSGKSVGPKVCWTCGRVSGELLASRKKTDYPKSGGRLEEEKGGEVGGVWIVEEIEEDEETSENAARRRDRFTESREEQRDGFSRSEGFLRTRITKSSCACDFGRGLLSLGAFFFLSFFLSFVRSFVLSFFLSFF